MKQIFKKCGEFTWKDTTEFIPEQGSEVQVIVCLMDCKKRNGIFNADSNWEIPGYPNDLFNDDIMVWKYI